MRFCRSSMFEESQGMPAQPPGSATATCSPDVMLKTDQSNSFGQSVDLTQAGPPHSTKAAASAVKLRRIVLFRSR